MDFVYQPLRDAGGRVTGIFVHGRDLTAQVLARREAGALPDRPRGERRQDEVSSPR